MGEGRTSLLVRLFDEPTPDIPDVYLARTFALASKGAGLTHPNPAVGCVIVKDDSVVGEGFHARAGGPHAEVVALEAAGSWTQGATAYVSLEPCNHHGKTPPCTEALIDAGIDRVIIGSPDPNPGVRGGGADHLRVAGIDVQFAADATPFEELNADWIHWAVTGRPWVTLKTALTLDGRASRARDQRTTITGSQARDITMRLRSQATAVAVGARTAMVDGPNLRLEGPYDPSAAPVRVVLSTGTGTTPAALAAALAGDPTSPWTVLTPVSASADGADPTVPGVEFLPYDAHGSLRSALKTLGDIGVVHVLVEAGPGLFTAFWDEDLIDQLVLYHAGGVLGQDAPPVYAMDPPIDDNAIRQRFAIQEVGMAGPDAVTVWRPVSDSSRERRET